MKICLQALQEHLPDLMRFLPKLIIKCIFINMGLVSPGEDTNNSLKTQAMKE